MNWLAHALLSEPDVEARLGNILADIVKGKDRLGLSPAFLRGIRLHQRIDAFTDTHAVVERSRARIDQKYRRVAGILVDIFYDHFLVLAWPQHSTAPLEPFIAELNREIAGYVANLPGHLHPVLDRMVADNWLGSYGTLDGIERTLRRLSRRLESRVGTTFGLESAASELVANLEGFRHDFTLFFPDLKGHLAAPPSSPVAALSSSTAPPALPI